MALKEKIVAHHSGILLYGITPTRAGYSFLKMKEISEKRIERIKNLPVDGVVIYDIQDESVRTDTERPFPFSPVVNPIDYANNFLKELSIEKIIYQSVGHYSLAGFKSFLDAMEKSGYLTVFVGTPSKDAKPDLRLSDAYSILKSLNNNILVGGIAIPERHAVKKNEHEKILDKINAGCGFFITQCVYNTEYVKDMLSDFYYMKADKTPAVIIFTLTACGSIETLSFMKWLGISIPHWLENELLNSENILYKSLSLCEKIAEELSLFCIEKRIPFGFNIESISIRKAEIEASIELLLKIESMLKRMRVR